MPETRECEECHRTLPITKFGTMRLRKGEQGERRHRKCRDCVLGSRVSLSGELHHATRRTPTYNSWKAMIRRCTDPNSNGWKYYGGRGITVCDDWLHNFATFLDEMGERPEGMTLDRIDSDGNYEPGNCRWATPKQQAANRRAATR